MRDRIRFFNVVNRKQNSENNCRRLKYSKCLLFVRRDDDRIVNTVLFDFKALLKILNTSN